MSDRRTREIPTATDELLAAGQRKVGEGRVNLRALKPVGEDDAETERNVQAISHSYGANARIPPAADAGQVSAVERAAARPQPAPAPVRTKFASWRIDMPEYLDQELTMRSARDRATKTYLVIEALHRAGYSVRPEDLVPDRRKTRWQRE